MKKININSKKYDFLDKNNFINENIKNMKNGDYLVFPTVLNKYELDTALKVAQTKIGFTHCYFAFDIGKCHDFNYNEWKFLINYAKQNNMKFLVNVSEEYNAYDMENYIERFSRINSEGQKELAFDYNYYSIIDSSLTSNRKNDYITTGIPVDNFIVISNVEKLNIDQYINDVDKGTNMIGFTLLEGETFNNSMLKKMKKVIDSLMDKYPDSKYDIVFSSAIRYYTNDEFDKLLKLEKYIKDKVSKVKRSYY